jgi:predicted Rossmann fold nucleotide-binding protein DprA/Smf involved in DNA uptake
MERRPLSDSERRDWRGLTRAENVGAITFWHRLPRYGMAAKALDAPPARLAEIEAYTGPLDKGGLAEAREIILENLRPSPISIDERIGECQLSAPLALTVLLDLELAGRIARQAGHKVALTDWTGPEQKAVGE